MTPGNSPEGAFSMISEIVSADRRWNVPVCGGIIIIRGMVCVADNQISQLNWW